MPGARPRGALRVQVEPGDWPPTRFRCGRGPRSARWCWTRSFAPLAPPQPPQSSPPGPARSVVLPGSTVHYRRVDATELRTVVLTGPTVPRGVSAVPLDTPFAQALLDAAEGDQVVMDLTTGPVELLIVRVELPP